MADTPRLTDAPYDDDDFRRINALVAPFCTSTSDAGCVARIAAEALRAARRDGAEKMRERAAICAQDYALLFASEHNNPAVSHNTAMNVRDNIRALDPETTP